MPERAESDNPHGGNMFRCLVSGSRAIVTALFLMIGLVYGIQATQAKMTDPEISASLAYLKSYQNQSDGGLKEKGQAESQLMQSSWAAVGISASGYDPASFKTDDQSQDLLNYIKVNSCALTSITDIERSILAVKSANQDPKIFFGCDLLDKVTTDGTTGKIGPDLMSTIFGSYVYKATKQPISNATVEYLKSQQKSDGGFDPSGWGTDSNTSSQVVISLLDAGLDKADPVILKTVSYLKNLQTENGGIKYDTNTWTVNTDSFSDSFVLQMISALGQDPKSVEWQADSGKSILDDLDSLRKPDGSYLYSVDSWGDGTPVWTTSIVLSGLSGLWYPVTDQTLATFQPQSSTSVSGSSVQTVQPVTPKPNPQPVATTTIEPSPPQIQPAIIPKVSAAKKIVVVNNISPKGAAVAPTQPPTVTVNQTPDSIPQPQVLGQSDQRPVGINYLWLAILGTIAFIIGVVLSLVLRRPKKLP